MKDWVLVFHYHLLASFLLFLIACFVRSFKTNSYDWLPYSDCRLCAFRFTIAFVNFLLAVTCRK